MELKNVDYTNTSLSTQTQDQLIDGYFKNINSLDDFQWIASFQKLKANGWTDQVTALANMKEKWKTVFLARKEDVFNGMTVTLRNDLELDSPSDLTLEKIEEIINVFVKVE